MIREGLDGVEAGDVIFVDSGKGFQEATVVRCTKKLVHTASLAFRKGDGRAYGSSCKFTTAYKLDCLEDLTERQMERIKYRKRIYLMNMFVDRRTAAITTKPLSESDLDTVIGIFEAYNKKEAL